ncbi:sensor histidine kinase [Sphingomonas azotifigens]|uniref:sensor histidine kinase n=1 Tax=Sphingomonas azotifigens TaxID=330920 RepID=UPI000A074073|nr:sensor histidine kinase [Sphingomonas azotifigens]
MRRGWQWVMLVVPWLLAGAHVLAAQRPLHRGLDQYDRRAWTLINGAPPDIWALEQTPDGFLWLGTGAGLYRFDGITFEPVVPAIGRFPSRTITALRAAADGSLWIGYFAGQVSHLRGGRIETFGTANAWVEELALARDGTVWVARGGPEGGLFRIDGRRMTRLGPDEGVPDGSAYSVIAARDGAIWVAGERDIRVLRPGARQFVPVWRSLHRTRLAQAPDGQIWASGDPADRAGAAAAGLAIAPLPPEIRAPGADRMRFTRDGTLWRTLFQGGVLQTRRPEGGSSGAPLFARLTPQQGLPSLVAVPMLEDREANLWIGTNLGLFRLRPVSATTALRIDDQVLGGFELAATADGTVFAANPHRLYRARAGEPLQLVRQFDRQIAMIEAEGNDLIVALFGEILRMRGDRVERMPVPPLPWQASSWARNNGTAWTSIIDQGVFLLSAKGWQRLTSDTLPMTRMLTPSGQGGGRWFYRGDQLYRRDGTALHAIPGDRIGTIALVSSGPAGLLVGGELGLARLEQGRLRAIDANRVPELSGITGIVQTAEGTVWINGVQGLIRTTRATLDTAFAQPGAPFQPQRFGAADGLPGVAQQAGLRSTAVRGGDGRIWVADNVGIGWIDPARIVRNLLPPPVLIRSLTANDRRYDAQNAIALPAGTANLRIAYTALSLAEAERVRFRYRLVGFDAGWVDAGTAREAYYANLGPGTWRFQVIAANNDGVWNTQGATVSFTIAPRFYQRWWFRLAALAVAAGMLWLLYAWRLREQIARNRGRLEAQLAERERIARELHDTLLQSMQGLMLRFQAAAYATEPGSKAQALLESALDRADDVMLEARDRVLALRRISGPGDPQPLIEALARCMTEDGLSVTVTRDGPPLRFQPPELEHILAIVQEALANVRRHARTHLAQVELHARPAELVVVISDQGIGIPPQIVADGGRSGHYGLSGMRERAAALGGTVAVQRGDPIGTRVRLTVPH